MLLLLVRKGVHTKIHTNKHKVIDSPLRNVLGTAQLGVSQGELTIKMGLNPDLEGVEKSPRERKILSKTKTISHI